MCNMAVHLPLLKAGRTRVRFPATPQVDLFNGVERISTDVRTEGWQPMDEQAMLNRLKNVIGTSLMEYATRLHAEELVSEDVEQVAIAA